MINCGTHTCNSSSPELEAGRRDIQGHPQLHETILKRKKQNQQVRKSIVNFRMGRQELRRSSQSSDSAVM